MRREPPSKQLPRAGGRKAPAEIVAELAAEGALTPARGPRDSSVYRGPPLPRLPLTSAELAALDHESPMLLTIAVVRDEGAFVATCLELDVASQGATGGEALVNVAEAVALRATDLG